jgi:ferric-dicitrate binding protein FerR (iron transport regulator)
MSERPHDLSEGWPPDPENAELQRFAEELQRSLPQLPEEALQRVGERLLAEATRRPPRLRWRIAGAAAAAALLLALGWGVGVLMYRPPAAVPDGPGVAETFLLDRPDPAGSQPPTRPLVRLDDNQSLFTD